MFPQIKLALVFGKIAKDHGPKLLHANNPDLLTRDLGYALKKQKDILSDPRKGMVMTAYDVLPIILEVKILSVATASKLGIPTKGKSDIQVLEDIIAASNARNGGKHAKDIVSTLEWTRALFAHPEIQDVLKMEMTEIESPKSLRGVLTFIGQLAGRSQDELVRVSEFLKRAKDLDLDPPAQKPEPQAAQKPARKPRAPKPPKAG